VKFLCLPCDEVMSFAEREIPGDGTFTAVFTCPGCDREMAMLANPMETQLVNSLGVEIGGRTLSEQPLEQVRRTLDDARDDVFADPPPPPPPGPAAGGSGPVIWTDEAVDRLSKVPSFVRGMVKRIYTDYARERGIEQITVAVMDRARTELGLEGM